MPRWPFFAATFLLTLTETVWRVIQPYLLRDAGMQPDEKGWYTAACTVAYIASCLGFWRVVPLRFRNFWLIILVSAVAGCWAAASRCVDNRPALWAFSIAAETAHGAFWPLMETVLMTGLTGAALRRAAGLFNASWTAAIVIGASIGGLLYDSGAGGLGLAIMAAGIAVFFIVIVRAPPEPPASDDIPPAPGKETDTPRRRRFWLAALLMNGFALAILMVYRTFFPEVTGLSAEDFGIMSAAAGALQFALSILLAKSSFWVDNPRLFIWSQTLLAAGMAVVLVFTGWWAAFAGMLILSVALAFNYSMSLYFSGSLSNRSEKRILQLTVHETMLVSVSPALLLAAGQAGAPPRSTVWTYGVALAAACMMPFIAAWLLRKTGKVDERKDAKG
jgi:predicted MFS family arabinose efflux permease